ncbi:MAG: beta-N-acetylhexosaminidase, partial [Chloroflexota bacterium]|nr:beta-N-acetylhexosaminidase [Chloroflexota bacterium]
KAGVDMLMVIGDRERQTIVRDALMDALVSGDLPRERVMDAVRHVVEAKARAGLLGGEPEPLPGC